MTLARVLVRTSAVDVAIADKPEDLKTLLQSGCAAIWLRPLMPKFQGWMVALAPNMFPQAWIILPPVLVPHAVTAFCDAAETPDFPEGDQLGGETSALTKVLAKLMNVPFLRPRLQAITTNTCRKFLIDGITARLVCTYCEQGKQCGVSADGQGPKRVFSVVIGARILLRRTLLPGKQPSGLRHRAPPIDGSEESRLVFVPDAIDSPETVI